MMISLYFMRTCLFYKYERNKIYVRKIDGFVKSLHDADLKKTMKNMIRAFDINHCTPRQEGPAGRLSLSDACG
jgi:predicted 2-oxoglutarate/Fe(II)-dependent dioxygenase YbiX